MDRPDHGGRWLNSRTLRNINPRSPAARVLFFGDASARLVIPAAAKRRAGTHSTTLVLPHWFPDSATRVRDDNMNTRQIRPGCELRFLKLRRHFSVLARARCRKLGALSHPPPHGRILPPSQSHGGQLITVIGAVAMRMGAVPFAGTWATAAPGLRTTNQNMRGLSAASPALH